MIKKSRTWYTKLEVTLEVLVPLFIKAILFGRTIFKSIRKFIIFQLTVNICALAISIIGPFINIESPITVVQMLWVIPVDWIRKYILKIKGIEKGV